MTTTEFSNEFNILYNNIASNQAPGLDEYEKSVLLTAAQEAVVTNLYNGNLMLESFDSTEAVKRYLGSLLQDKVVTEFETISSIFDDNTKFVKLEEDVFYLVYESAVIKDKSFTCNTDNQKTILIVPTTVDDYFKYSQNPFKKPNCRKGFRVDYSDTIIELISPYDIIKYQYKYIKKPDPIILIDLEDGTSINGKTEEATCKLNTALHRIILEQAVKLAKVSMYSNNQ